MKLRKMFGNVLAMVLAASFVVMPVSASDHPQDNSGEATHGYDAMELATLNDGEQIIIDGVPHFFAGLNDDGDQIYRPLFQEFASSTCPDGVRHQWQTAGVAGAGTEKYYIVYGVYSSSTCRQSYTMYYMDCARCGQRSPDKVKQGKGWVGHSYPIFGKTCKECNYTKA
jgi:hypothetical protein